jgi:hypothetical protein
MKNGKNIDYFHVKTGLLTTGFQRIDNNTTWFQSVKCNTNNIEHVVLIKNTGHFDADLWPAGEIAQPSKGLCFKSGLQWIGEILDLRQTEERSATEPVDLSKASSGSETLRGGIWEYLDRFTGNKYTPSTQLPLSEIITITT